jgi:hypothetical protein
MNSPQVHTPHAGIQGRRRRRKMGRRWWRRRST